MTSIDERVPLAMAQRRRRHLTPDRIGIYVFLVTAALFFMIPLYIMIVTSLKGMPEIRMGNIFALPEAPSIEAWVRAWDTACTGLNCEGIKVGFWNSIRILVPSVVFSILFGAINGYAMSLWRVKHANLILGLLMIGAFVPYQVFLFPMVRILSFLGLYSSLPGIVLVHVIFGLPLTTLIFRNYYATLPEELFKAARIDGGGFFSIFFHIVLPMSTPILIVVVILQVTGIWNDYLLGLIFAGLDNLPMTVQLNNIVNATFGERLYNVNMAATVLTALVPLTVYLLSGKYFVRGITSGAMKG